MKLLCSMISAFVFGAVIFGAPAYDAFHGIWPGKDLGEEPVPFNEVRSGATAKQIERNLQRESILKRLVRPRYNEIKFQATGITNPSVLVGNDNWLFPSEILKKPCKEEWDMMPEIVKSLGELTRYIESHGGFVVFEFIPRKQTLHPDMLPKAAQEDFFPTYTIVREAMLREGLHVPDLRPALSGMDPQVFLTNDSHWTPEGCHLAAKVIADYIRENIPGGQIPGKPLVVEFKRLPPTKRVGYEQRLLGFRRGSRLDNQFDNFVPSVHATLAGRPDAPLIGTSRPRPILLIGTSMSMGPYYGASQMIGWLGVDVEDYSRDGFAAGYRAVDKFKGFITNEHPFPKVLIWEIPEDFISREGRYMLEPLMSVLRILDGAPFQKTDIPINKLELSGIPGSADQDGIFKGETKGPQPSIELELPRSVGGAEGAVLSFEITIPNTTKGPHTGLMTVEWGINPDSAPIGQKEILLRVTHWLHPILVPLKGMEGDAITFVRVRPPDKNTSIDFGKFELLTRTESN